MFYIVETTVTVRLDTQLKSEADRTLDRLGLSMSAAVRVFLSQLVLQQRMPFAVDASDLAGEVDRDTPPEILAELLLELIGTTAARLARLEAAEPSAARRAKLARTRTELLARRFEFDPHDGAQIERLLREVNAQAAALRA